MGGTNSIITFDTDDNIPKKENIMRIDGLFSRISYSAFKSSVLPIISDKPSDQDKTLYDDRNLPSSFKLKVREFEDYIENEVNLTTFIGTWFICKLPVNLIKNGNIFTGVNLFDKWVLALTIPSLLFGFKYTKQLVSQLDFVSVEDLLFTDKTNPYIRQYRKRLVETHPDYARKMYTQDAKWLESDGVSSSLFAQLILEGDKTENKAEENKAEEEVEEEEELTASQLEYLQILELEKNQNK